MTPLHSDFEAKVLEDLAVLRRDMRRLVGDDGNGGVVGELAQRVTEIEQREATSSGRDQGSNRWYTSVVAAALSSIGTFVIVRIFHL